MKFATYFSFSFLAMVSLFTFAIYTREQFYPIVLFLVTSKISFVIAGNMILASALLLGHVSKSIFLGPLRDAELELLTERAKYTITETCLALTIFRNELSPSILGLFGALLFLKAFHWMGKSRLDHLEQVMPVGFLIHIRLMSLIVVLAACDMSFAYSCMSYTLEHGKSVLILFGFEFGLLVISIFNLACRYALHLLDARIVNGLPNKALYGMIADLACDAMKFVTYVIFFSLVFVYYGLPIHLVRELWMSFYNFHRHLTSFVRYLRLTSNLDQRFADATPAEIEACGDCLICREHIERGKKLPCAHVFHLECLRMWLQHQQSCPLCRADIPITAAPQRVGAAAEAAAARADVAAAAAMAAEDDLGVAAGGAPARVAAPAAPAAAAAAAAAAPAAAAVNAVAIPVPTPAPAAAAAPAPAPVRAREPLVQPAAAAAALPVGAVPVRAPARTPNPAGTVGPSPAHTRISGNASHSGSDSDLPGFFLVVAPSIAVCASPASEQVLRTISQGIVVFAAARELDADGNQWLHLPDGWTIEGTAAGSSTRLVPYVPPEPSLNSRFLSPLVPQPARGFRSRTASANAGSIGEATTSGREAATPSPAAVSPRPGDLALFMPGSSSTPMSAKQSGSKAGLAQTWTSGQNSTSSSAFKSPVRDLATMVSLQERMQCLSSDLASMQGAIEDCQSTLSSLVADCVQEVEQMSALGFSIDTDTDPTPTSPVDEKKSCSTTPSISEENNSTSTPTTPTSPYPQDIFQRQRERYEEQRRRTLAAEVAENAI